MVLPNRCPNPIKFLSVRVKVPLVGETAPSGTKLQESNTRIYTSTESSDKGLGVMVTCLTYLWLRIKRSDSLTKRESKGRFFLKSKRFLIVNCLVFTCTAFPAFSSHVSGIRVVSETEKPKGSKVTMFIFLIIFPSELVKETLSIFRGLLFLLMGLKISL